MGRCRGRDKRLDSGSRAPHIASIMPDSAKPAAKPAPAAKPEPAAKPAAGEVEYGGPKGPEPTRYGDWEKNGRCSDF
jgi:hypothetical protein